MAQKNGIKLWLFFSLLTYFVMVIINTLANILPINGLQTGEISDRIPNLFAPAGYTFSIWGLIYLLLLAFLIHEMVFCRGEEGAWRKPLHGYFILSSVANALWVFCWHYLWIPITLLLMLVILYALIRMNRILGNQSLSTREKIFVRLPFSVYFGWITVATIANVTALLVFLGWQGWGLSEAAWMTMVVLVGLLIGTVTTVRQSDWAYAAVLIWAYGGILYKHLSPSGFGGKFPTVIATVSLSMGILLCTLIYVLVKEPSVKKA